MQRSSALTREFLLTTSELAKLKRVPLELSQNRREFALKDFKLPLALVICWTQQQHQVGILCVLGDHTRLFPFRGGAAVSHGSSAAGEISLDIVLRIDGLLALTLWEIVIDVLNPSLGIMREATLCTTTKGDVFVQEGSRRTSDP